MTCKGLKQGNIEDMNAFEFAEANDDDDDDGLQVQSAHESMSYRGRCGNDHGMDIEPSPSQNVQGVIKYFRYRESQPQHKLGAVMSICWLGIQD